MPKQKKTKRTLSPEQLEAARERMAKARAARKDKVEPLPDPPGPCSLVDIPEIIEEPEITIDRLPPNPSLVIGSADGYPDPFHIWVGNAQNFALGMKIKVHPHPTEAGLWEYTGPLPRQPGRWLA